MARNELFRRSRDGTVDVLLNEFGREFLRDRFMALAKSQEDLASQWHLALHQPIDPSRDNDDPLMLFDRQRETASNVELALMTVDEATLTEGEAWAWLSSLQLVLRATAVSHGLTSNEQLDGADEEDLVTIRNLQILLFALSEVLD